MGQSCVCYLTFLLPLIVFDCHNKRNNKVNSNDSEDGEDNVSGGSIEKDWIKDSRDRRVIKVIVRER
jgi:hypothetical protein